MLRALYTVVQNEAIHSDPIFILGPTALVNTFCKNHECAEIDTVKDYVSYLEAKIFENMRRDLSHRATREKVCVLL